MKYLSLVDDLYIQSELLADKGTYSANNMRWIFKFCYMNKKTIVFIICGLLFAIIAFGIISYVDSRTESSEQKIQSSSNDLLKQTTDIMKAAEDSLDKE